MSKPLINAITDSRGVIIQISGRGADMVGTVYKAADTGKSIGNVTAVGGGSAIASFGQSICSYIIVLLLMFLFTTQIEAMKYDPKGMN